jgi:ketosteroid isomerase-like protein
MKQNWTTIIIIAVFSVANLGAAKLLAQKQNDEELLRARETVWRAWFAGDTKTLEKLVPPETIVMSGGEKEWKGQSDVLRSSAAFHSQGGELVRLEFPRTEVQHFGDVAIVWSSYASKRRFKGSGPWAQAG